MTSHPASASDKTSFNTLEEAVLNAIAAQYPANQDELKAQFAIGRVVKRHNTGAGFFTDFEVERQRTAPIDLPRAIGNVWADVSGLQAPMTFLVFTEGGYAKMLEGATTGSEGTASVDFSQVRFTVHA